ncbi:MAG: hypothetical protein AB7V27_04540 [Candidatus Binatia bacterium]
MDTVIHLVAQLRDYPWLAAALAVAAAAGYFLLQRKSHLQREADAHLAALRRERRDRYGQFRPPR